VSDGRGATRASATKQESHNDAKRQSRCPPTPSHPSISPRSDGGRKETLGATTIEEAHPISFQATIPDRKLYRRFRLPSVETRDRARRKPSHGSGGQRRLAHPVDRRTRLSSHTLLGPRGAYKHRWRCRGGRGCSAWNLSLTLSWDKERALNRTITCLGRCLISRNSDDHFRGAKFFHLSALDARFAQNLVGMLAEPGRDAPHLRRCL
jgi:hypothetical protein